MTPSSFLDYDGGSSPSDPVGLINDAMYNSPLIIRSANAEWKVLSYYYDRESTAMVIDIAKKKP